MIATTAVPVVTSPSETIGVAREFGASIEPAASELFSLAGASAANERYDLAGASAADERYDLIRHGRSARTHARHDPVTWNYHHVGSYLLNGELPPNHGQI
jgi:hypothetical protein